MTDNKELRELEERNEVDNLIADWLQECDLRLVFSNLSSSCLHGLKEFIEVEIEECKFPLEKALNQQKKDINQLIIDKIKLEAENAKLKEELLISMATSDKRVDELINLKAENDHWKLKADQAEKHGFDKAMKGMADLKAKGVEMQVADAKAIAKARQEERQKCIDIVKDECVGLGKDCLCLDRLKKEKQE